MIQEADFTALKTRIESGASFVLDIYAKWCHPCRLLDKEIEAVEGILPHIEVVRVDYDRNTEIIDFLGIGSLPYLVIFKEGHNVAKIKGFHNAAFLMEEISKSGI